MSKYTELSKELRNDPNTHYNCCQSVILPYAVEMGYDKDQVFDLCRALGGGLREGATCGAIVGSLMVLGIHKKDDPDTVAAFYQKFKERHDGMTNCKDLLAANASKGGEKKPHCDGLVYECIEILCELI